MAVLDDPMTLAPRIGTGYPEPFSDVAPTREKRAMGNALGLTHYGVNIVHVPPGEGSAQRHWHTEQDEFVYMLEGELTLITDDGEKILTAGMAAGFPAGSTDAHQLVNKTDAVAAYLEVGDRVPGDSCNYPDIDLHGQSSDGLSMTFVHKDGTPYEPQS
jgi:uncharacterized cupin superfamily protein